MNIPVCHPPVSRHSGAELNLPDAGDSDIRFPDVSGLSMELEEETYIASGENLFIQKFLARALHPGLVHSGRLETRYVRCTGSGRSQCGISALLESDLGLVPRSAGWYALG